MITIDPLKCPQNHRCPATRVCPTGAISQSGFGLPFVDQSKCVKCLECVKFCPMGAIQNK